MLIKYVADKSNETGLVSATLGLTFYIEESHFAPRDLRKRPSGTYGPEAGIELGLDGVEVPVGSRERPRDPGGGPPGYGYSAPPSGIQEKELWVKCEATMPPIEGKTYPFTREAYLGSTFQTFDHYQSKSLKTPSK